MIVRPDCSSGVVILLLSAALLACAPSVDRTAESLTAWEDVAAVLQHPRCLNCHQMDSPLQADERRAHTPHVVRGLDNHGMSAMRCDSCHNQMGNNETSGVPGAPHWQLSPVSMLWQGLSSRELCESLLDPARNGGRSHKDLVTHMGEDPLVLWGWNPGTGREPVHMAHDQFVETLEIWLGTGAHCPSN